MIQGLEQAKRTDLLPLGYLFSAYTFDKENDQQWLKERFKKMKYVFEDNWAYREMVQEAETKALKQGMKHVLVRIMEIHFPDLVLLAKQQAELATTSQQLQEMVDKLLVAHTDKEAKAILLGERE